MSRRGRHVRPNRLLPIGRPAPAFTRQACRRGPRNRLKSLPAISGAGGLNSTPVLIFAFIFVICLQVLKISYKRSDNQRDKKGKVGYMRCIAVNFGGRSAASLAATYSALAGYLKLSGGSG